MKKKIGFVPMEPSAAGSAVVSPSSAVLSSKEVTSPQSSSCTPEHSSAAFSLSGGCFASISNSHAPRAGLQLGELEIFPKSRRVRMQGREVSLTPKEFDILWFLAQNRGEVFTKEQIYRAVWSDNYLLDDSNIMAFIRKLRKKIEPDPDAPRYILTLWGIGYKFNDQL